VTEPTQQEPETPQQGTDDSELVALLDYVKESRGFDFTGYKRSSLTRRIRKRMDTLHFSRFGDYHGYLERDGDEFADLFNTILINVTSFFRDPDIWQFLAENVVPEIVAARRPDQPIRVWAPGCATGEEPYSIAMLLCEEVGEEAFRHHVKIYATDVDQDALTEARRGRYLKRAITDNVPPDLLERYFDADDGYMVFRKDLRRSVIFGRHDLVQDPPISRIDLLSCRNTLMYFTSDTQKRILANLHFALRPTGYLVLGRSEALTTRSADFSPLDLKRRIFKPTGSRKELRLADDETATPQATRAGERPTDVRGLGFELGAVAQILLDVSGNLVAANHHARALFALTTRDIGRPVQDLEISYRPLELRSRLDTVYSDRHAVAERGVEWRSGGDTLWFDVMFHPIINAAGALEGTSVAFIDVTAQRRLQEDLQRSKIDLDTAYEELQSAVEELETTNEELQSTNEELETTNEELQSTNEELETTNEELQSTNEELETINDELRPRTTELHGVNGFLESILTSLNSAVVVVDRDMRVQVWNRHAYDLWGLRTEEVEGQHLMNLDIGLPLDRLQKPLRASLVREQGRQNLDLEAVNRRGRAITCHVGITPLLRAGGDGEDVIGAILLMDAGDGTSGPIAS
jgi:two-component system, chemotaxis family, CheB/CheR fusion protein